MDQKLIVKIERLASGVILPIKRKRYGKLEEKARMLDEMRASAEEKRNLQRQLRGYRNRIHSLERVRAKDEPPTLAEVVLRLLPIKNHDCVIGDLLEGYAKRVKLEGKKLADRWFYCQVLRSALPLIITTLWQLILAYIRRRS
jgi:hypothetical protein